VPASAHRHERAMVGHRLATKWAGLSAANCWVWARLGLIGSMVSRASVLSLEGVYEGLEELVDVSLVCSVDTHAVVGPGARGVLRDGAVLEETS